MKHLIKTMILILAIMLPVIAHASQPLADDQGDDVTLPGVPEITVNTFDDYVTLGATDVEGATVVFYQCDDEAGANPRVINNPTNFNRESQHYDVFVYAVASNAAGETSSVVTRVLIPAKVITPPDPYNPPDYIEGQPGEFMLDGIYYYRNDDNVTVTYGLSDCSYNNYSGDITIPKTIVYQGKTYSVTTIGASAFRSCIGLTSITLPSSIKKFDYYAFYNCSSLKRVNITDINAWLNTNFLDSLANPLNEAHHLYLNENEITELTFPNMLTSIGNYVFSGCSGLKSVTIPSSITSIGRSAFSGCSGLTSIALSSSLNTIGDYAFSGCSGLTNIALSSSLNTIGNYAFSHCSGLTSITIPNSVTFIGDGAFTYCTGLNTINVDSSNPIYDSRDNCNAIVKTSENEIIAGCKGTVIPSSVTNIKGLIQEYFYHDGPFSYYYLAFVGYGAFEGINMDSLIIPASITNIGHGAFQGSHINKIYYHSLDCGSYYFTTPVKPYDDFYCYPFAGCQADEFIIGSNITQIPSYLASDACFSSIIIPNSVTSIGERAFNYCEELSSIYLIGEGDWNAGLFMDSFDSYTIANLYIDAGLTSVKGLHVAPIDVYCYATVPPQCDDYSFTDYSGTLHVPAASIASYFTAPYWCNFANIVGDDFEVPNSITLSVDSIEIKVGKTFNLIATVNPMNTLYDSFTMWQSSDNDIASVANGIVTGLSEGECDITVSCLGKKAICHVKIVCPISSLSLDQTEVTLEEEQSFSLTATILPESESSQIITWSSSNTGVAVVNKGLVTAIAEGECDITATCLGIKAMCHVIVTKHITIITITIDEQEVAILPNHIISLTPSATPVMPESFTASSSDPTVAAPRIMNGEVQVVGIKEGTATITVGSADGPTVPATCLVTVYTEPGDVNCDGFRNISDVSSLINYLLSGDDSSIKIENADLNVDGKVAIGDVSALISGLLSGEWPSVETDDHEWVDLGLPSGTLWATCNVGASAPEEFGDYFAWGETKPRDFYDWTAYDWSAGSSTTMTKYCTSSSYGYEGFTDGKTELDLEDDAAYVNWGKKWRMPTYEQHTELYTQCTWTWTTQNGVKGYLVTGPNGNTMFVPAAGYHSERSHYSAGTEGRYWLSTLYSDRADHSYCLYFNSGSVSWDDSRRYRGFSVRAVRVSQH